MQRPDNLKLGQTKMPALPAGKLAELQRSEDIHKNVVTELKCSGSFTGTYYESTLQKYFFKKSIFT